MEKCCQQVADYTRAAFFGLGASIVLHFFVITDHISSESLLGYGLAGVLLIIAMMLLMARVVNSLTRKYGATEAAANYDWRLDAVICVLLAALIPAHLAIGAAIYQPFGATNPFFNGICYMILLALLLDFGAIWINLLIYRYLLWVRSGDKQSFAINPPHSVLFPTSALFLMEGSRWQINTSVAIPFMATFFGAQCAMMFSIIATSRLDYASRHIDGFNGLGYLQTSLLFWMSTFLFCILVGYLIIISTNACYAGIVKEPEMRFRWKQDLLAIVSALLLFLAQAVMMFAVYFALGIMLGSFLVFSYLILLVLLFGKKWFVLGLSSCFSRLGFDKKGTA